MILKNSFLQTVGFLTQKFYCLKLRLLIRGFERGKILSILLIIIKSTLLFLLCLLNEEYHNIAEADSNMKILAKSNYIDTLNNKYSQYIQGFGLILNLLIVLYLFISYCIYLYIGYFSYVRPVQQKRTSVEIVEVSEDDILEIEFQSSQNFINQLMGSIIQIYPYIFQIPIIFFGIYQISSPIAELNILLAFIIGLIIIDSDFNYSVKSDDFMSRPFNQYYFFILISEVITIMIIIESSSVDNIFIAINFFFAVWFQTHICPFYKKSTRFWNIFINVYFGVIVLIYEISVLHYQLNSFSSLLTILLIPIFYKFSELSCIYYDKKDKQILQDIFFENRDVSLKELDRVIRMNIFENEDSMKQYERKQVNLFNLIVKKKQQMQKEEAKKQKNLTNSQYQLNIIKKQIEKEQDAEEIIRSSLKEYIRKQSRKKGEEYQKQIYLIYLLEILNCKKSYWTEYAEMRKKKLSIKQEQIIIGVHIRFLKQKDILQKIHGFSNPFNTSYQGVLDFEARIQHTYELFDLAMKQKVELLVTMKNKTMFASDLIQRVSKLRNEQIEIRNELNELAVINNNNSDLLSLQICYLENLAFSEKDIKLGYNSSGVYNNRFSQLDNVSKARSRAYKGKKIQKNIKRGDGDETSSFSENLFDEQSLYDKNSCVVFVSIEDGINLVFKKISNNFADMFSMSINDAINKKIDIIMPNSFPIAQRHKSYLVNFLKTKDTDRNGMLYKVVFAQSLKGYIVPLNIDIRLNYCYQFKEIGFCAQMKKCIDQADYLLFHSVTLNFIGITSNLQNIVFPKNHFSNKMDMGQIFPFLNYLRTNSLNVKSPTGGTEWEATTVDPMSIGSEMQLTSQRLKDDSFQQKIKSNFEFLLIFENKKDSAYLSKQITTQTLMKVLNDRDFSFFFMEILIKSSEYKDLDYLSYMKITRIKHLTPMQNGPLILQHLRESQELYTRIFSKSIIDRLILDVEMKYKKASQNIDKKSPFIQSNSINESQIVNISQLNPQNSPIGALGQNMRSDQMLISDVTLQKQKAEKEQKSHANQLNLRNSISKGNGIDEIVEEEHSISSVSANASLDSPKNTKPYNDMSYSQLETVKKNVKLNEPQNVQNDILGTGINGGDGLNIFSNRIKSGEYILSDNNRETQILSNNNREIQILRDNKNNQFIMSDNNNEQISFSDINNLQYVLNDKNRGKFVLNDEELRAKQQSIQFNINQPLLSPINSPVQQSFQGNFSTHDLIRNKQQSIYFNTAQAGDINKNNSSIIQNSQLGQSVTMDNSCSTFAIGQQKFFYDRDGTQNFMQSTTKDATQKNTDKVKNLKEIKKQQLIDHQLDAGSSAKTKESSTSTKRVLISMIKAQTSILAISVINAIGLVAFITLAVVTLQQYISIMSSLNVSQDNLTVQNWPQEVQITINRSTKNLNIVQLERQNQFIFNSKDDQQSFDDEFVNRLLNSKDEFLELVNYMETTLDGFMLFNAVAAYKSSFNLGLYYKPGNLTGQSSRRSTVEYYTEPYNFSLLYCIVMINQYIHRQALNAGARVQEFLVLTNLNSLVDGIKDIQNEFSYYQEEQDVKVQNQLTSLIIVILLISAACLFTILPLYSFIQGKRDIIIHLFCTFPTNQLQTMIQKMRSSYYQNKSISSHIKHIPVEIQALNNNMSTQDQSHLKKQTLSQITKLPSFNLNLLIILCLAYIFLSIYPIINKIIIQKFIDQQANNLIILCKNQFQFIFKKQFYFQINQTEKLNNVKEFVLETSAMTAFGLVMKLYPTVKVVQLSQYISDIRILMNKTSTILDSMQYISNQVELEDRYQQEEFTNFFFATFEDDLCKTIGNHPQYILNSTKFQPDVCSTIQNGFLQKGLKLSMKKFTGYVLDMYQILEIADDDILKTSATSLQQSLDLRDYAYFIDYLEETLSILKQFILENSTQYYQYLVTVQLAIIIYQILLMALIFGIGWYWFSTSLSNSITITKQYLQVININYLLDNNYILTFVKNNQKL